MAFCRNNNAQHVHPIDTARLFIPASTIPVCVCFRVCLGLGSPVFYYPPRTFYGIPWVDVHIHYSIVVKNKNKRSLLHEKKNTGCLMALTYLLAPGIGVVFVSVERYDTVCKRRVGGNQNLWKTLRDGFRGVGARFGGGVSRAARDCGTRLGERDDNNAFRSDECLAEVIP